MFKIKLNRRAGREFAGFASAMEHARQWSLRVEVPVCVWENVQTPAGTGPFHVRRWSDAWPEDGAGMICAYCRGENVADLAFLFDGARLTKTRGGTFQAKTVAKVGKYCYNKATRA